MQQFLRREQRLTRCESSRRVEDLIYVGGLVQDAGRPGFHGPGVILPVEARGQDQRREERVGLAQVLDQLDPLTVGEGGL